MNWKYQYLTALFLVLSLSLKAQEQAGLRDRANRFYAAYQYADAVNIYLKLADVKKPKLHDLERLANSYQKMNNYEAAENWFARVIQYPESKQENLMSYASVLKSNSRYQEAKKMFQQYATQTGDDKRVSNEIAGCDSALLWMARPTDHQLKNEAQVNTSSSEFGVFMQGNKVFYTGEPDVALFRKTHGRTGRPFLRIFNADRNADHSLSHPVTDKEIYNKEIYHAGPLISNKKGDTYFITRTHPRQEVGITTEEKFSFKTNNLELYIYTREKDDWKVTAFPYNNVKKYSIGHAALSPDEKTLYFVSDMPGGFGGTDIWYSDLATDGKWGEPQNAGTTINSAGNEMFPYINADGTLYYSTDGLPGMGGLDIFEAKGKRNNWSKPSNLKYPVNSAADDFAFISHNDENGVVSGYLSSNRKGGKGEDDIYSFHQAKSKLILSLAGTTLNKKTGELVTATVTLFSKDRQIIAKQSSDGSGNFYFEVERGMDYSILGQKEKFYSDSVMVSTTGLHLPDTIKVVLKLEPLFEVGKTIAIKNIHYDFDKDNIRKDAAKILDELVRVMRDNPTLEIELGSHTDSRGVDVYNLDLSQRRARSVVSYLTEKGIARSRMTAKGYGETQLLNRCANGVDCSVAEHQANRRTEFKILKY